MTSVTFWILLAIFSALTSLVTEGIKNKFLPDMKPKFYSVVALVVALVIGIVGSFLYYMYNYIPIDALNIVTAIVMGFASALASMVGYDKVHDVFK